MSSKNPIVFVHEGVIYAATSYEVVDEQKLSDYVNDISSTLEAATTELTRFRELAELHPQTQKKDEDAEPTNDATVETEQPSVEVPASAAITTDEAQPQAEAPVEQPTPVDQPLPAEPQPAQVEPAATPAPEPQLGASNDDNMTPPAEATSVETVHIQ